MAGLYIHIPFCRKVCSYCDFYKSTRISHMPAFIIALDKEMQSRAGYLEDKPLDSVYFGGGTPSVLDMDNLQRIFHRIRMNYVLSPECEITLEANPDDLTKPYLDALITKTPVNRLSIGIQSLDDRDLSRLNRRHNAEQAVRSVHDAITAGFRNISIDLIYGLPGMQADQWKRNLEAAFNLDVTHVSAYHLTIEPNTALSRLHRKGLIHLPEEAESAAMFKLLHAMATERGFDHYEISNLSKPGYRAVHNTNYWLQKSYLGFGPAAHSFNGVSRQWNVSDLKGYIESIMADKPCFESELLDKDTRLNEYLMLSLRTCWGLSRSALINDFGKEWAEAVESKLRNMPAGWIERHDDRIVLTVEGWLVSDYITSELIRV